MFAKKYKELIARFRDPNGYYDEEAADALEHLVGIIEEAGKQEAVATVDANDNEHWADIMPDRSVYVGQYLFAHPDYASAARITELEQQNAMLLEFIKKIAEQTPEKPDYWSSCSQCEHNISEAEDVIAAVKGGAA